MFLNVLKFGLSEGLAKIAPFLTTLYVANFLAPAEFGKYSLIVVMFEIVFIFVSFNIQATTRIDYYKENKNEFNKIKQNHFILSIFLSIIIACFALLQGQSYLTVALLISCALFRTVSVFILAIFQCSSRVNSYILSNIVFVVSLTVCILLFITPDNPKLSWLYSFLVASIIQLLLIMYLYDIYKLRKFVPSSISLHSLKHAFLPAALFFPQAIGWWLKSGAERVMIANSLGDVVLGIYALALQLVAVLFIFVTVVNLAMVPEINLSMSKNNYIKTKKMLVLSTFAVVVVACMLPFFGSLLIQNLYAAEYGLASDYLLLLTISSVPQAIMMFYINVLYFNKEGRFVASVIFLSFSLQTLINYFFINYYDIQGVIYCSFIINLIALLCILKRVKISMNKPIESFDN